MHSQLLQQHLRPTLQGPSPEGAKSDSTSSQHRQNAVPVTYVLQVRVKCVQTIGKLVMDYSSKFLDNSHLKYIGWALYDKVADVRLVALEALDVFYNSSLIPNLEAFTTRFR